MTTLEKTPAAYSDLLPLSEIHVWRASLKVPVRVYSAMRNRLTADERARADAFQNPAHVVRFVAARAILRSILARYIGCKTADVPIGYGRFGKPAVLANSGRHMLQFNLSHSGALALYALGLEREVGVDVEHVDERFAFIPTAQLFFTKTETSSLAVLPPERQHAAFFRIWTRKEALAKACGLGAHLDFRTLESGDPPRLAGAGPRAWKCVSLTPEGGYAAAVAAEGDDWSLRLIDWRFDLLVL
jgi:4'-phosphopantetheinyl transferase